MSELFGGWLDFNNDGDVDFVERATGLTFWENLSEDIGTNCSTDISDIDGWEDMDADERREAMEEAGLELDDYETEFDDESNVLVGGFSSNGQKEIVSDNRHLASEGTGVCGKNAAPLSRGHVKYALWVQEGVDFYDKFERRQQDKTNLWIRSLDDIPDSLSEIKDILIDFKYDRNAMTILPSILNNAVKLETLCTKSSTLTWDDVSSLDLSSISSFSFSLKGFPTERSIVAPKLRELWISEKTHLTPMELLAQPMPHIDFSNMPNIETLNLRNFQQIDPNDFRSLKNLKRLYITNSNIVDLDWLKDTEYQLELLLIDGELLDCSGIIYQQNLQSLTLSHSCLKDVSPIEKLKKLRSLDLRFGENTDEGNLRTMGFEKLIITKRDI